MKIKGDLHIHTKYSKEPSVLKIFGSARARYGPEEVFKRARKIGLDAVAITDHDTMDAIKIAEKAHKRYKDIIFIPGEEITTTAGHIIALGIKKEIPPGITPEKAVEEIKKQGGISIAPHPFAPYGIRSWIFRLPFDGIETLNVWGTFLRLNRKAQRAIKLIDVAEIGSSDAHSLSTIGKMYTEFNVKKRTSEAVLEAIRKKQTEAVSILRTRDFFKAVVLGIGQSFVDWKH
jgi:predicted metal-dependent phosphoesterase TrpH